MIKLLVGLLFNFPRICEYFFKIVEAYEKNEPIMGKITSKCKWRHKVAAVFATSSLLTSGCKTIQSPQSKIPHFISKLKVHSFTKPQKETIAEILRYENDLEHRR